MLNHARCCAVAESLPFASPSAVGLFQPSAMQAKISTAESSSSGSSHHDDLDRVTVAISLHHTSWDGAVRLAGWNILDGLYVSSIMVNEDKGIELQINPQFIIALEPCAPTSCQRGWSKESPSLQLRA